MTIPYQELKAKALRNPEVSVAYEALAAESSSGDFRESANSAYLERKN